MKTNERVKATAEAIRCNLFVKEPRVWTGTLLSRFPDRQTGKPMVRVLLDGRKEAVTYWAGFWEPITAFSQAQIMDATLDAFARSSTHLTPCLAEIGTK